MRRIHIDTSRIDMNNLEIQKGLEIDLKRMNKLKHELAPEEADKYMVKVRPAADYRQGLYRFIFEIQYGYCYGYDFIPVGEKIEYSTQTLPFL